MEIRRALASRSLRLALAAGLLVDLAVLGTDVYLLSNRSTTTVVDLQDALVTFRSAGGAAPVTSAPAGGAEVTAPQPSVAPAAPTTAAEVVPTTAPVAPIAVPANPSVVAPGRGSPADGVYAYRTTGGESISVLGAHHSYPAVTYTVVRRTGGCGWQIRSEVVKEHVDERTMCSDVDRLLQLTQTREVEFFGTRDGGTFTCTPPQVQFVVGEQPGVKAQTDCGDGKGSSARLIRTNLGSSRMTIAGVEVDVVKVRVDGTMTGRVRGTSADVLTLVASTGLPVRWERSVDTLADAFGTSVRYQEQAQFDLSSLTPET